MRVRDYPELPYPGLRPSSSWQLSADGTMQRWDGEQQPPGRVPLLAYGSLACPGAVRAMQLDGLPDVVLSAVVDVSGAAAVLCCGERRAGGRPATLAVQPGVERHAVWWATDGQIDMLDTREGWFGQGSTGSWYARVQLNKWAPQVTVHTPGGLHLTETIAYVGVRPERQPQRDARGATTLLRKQQ